MKLTEEFEVETLRKALKNIDHKEQIIIDVLTTSSHEQLQQIKRVYKATFGAEFAEEIRKLDGRQLLVDLCGKCVEDSDEVDAYAAYEDALAIIKEKEDRCAEKECNLRKALLTRSWAHLRQMFAEYERLTFTSVESLAEVVNWEQDRQIWLPDIIAPIQDYATLPIEYTVVFSTTSQAIKN
ncbi:annexin B11 isoform B [Aphelenchoides avenae]|nr:annexin B11 isoform B [Aphelenchus avenae]